MNCTNILKSLTLNHFYKFFQYSVEYINTMYRKYFKHYLNNGL